MVGIGGGHMLVEGFDIVSGVQRCTVQWRLGRLGGRGVVTVFQVRAGLVHRGQSAVGDGNLLGGLLGGLLLGTFLQQLLKASVVLARFGQQGWAVVLGQQARTV